MARSSKVFVYNGQGTDSDSVEDLKELFTSNHIFTNRPDVLLSDFNFNAADLYLPTFVIPGGSAVFMGFTLQKKMKSLLGEDYNYVGDCAGAFIATNQGDLFDTSHQRDDSRETLKEPYYFLTTQESETNLG